jgi:thiamine-phosphate pyrophosphorylase
LVAITDLELLPLPALEARLTKLCREAKPGHVAVLLRDHGASAQLRFQLGQRLRGMTRAAQQQLWVADRLDLALLLEADGAHLGEGSVSAAAARRLVGSRLSLSRAWHDSSLEGSSAAELEGVDALLASPVLQPRHGRPALGVPGLASLVEAARAQGRPVAVYALGGVGPADVAPCLSAGARGVAAIGAALTGDLAALLQALGSAA